MIEARVYGCLLSKHPFDGDTILYKNKNKNKNKNVAYLLSQNDIRCESELSDERNELGLSVTSTSL